MFLSNTGNVDQQVTAVTRLRGLYDSSILDAAKKNDDGTPILDINIATWLW